MQQKRIVKSMEEKYLARSLDLVEKVFAEYDCEREGKTVRALVEEIRSLKLSTAGSFNFRGRLIRLCEQASRKGEFLKKNSS